MFIFPGFVISVTSFVIVNQSLTTVTGSHHVFVFARVVTNCALNLGRFSKLHRFWEWSFGAGLYSKHNWFSPFVYTWVGLCCQWCAVSTQAPVHIWFFHCGQYTSFYHPSVRMRLQNQLCYKTTRKVGSYSPFPTSYICVACDIGLEFGQTVTLPHYPSRFLAEIERARTVFAWFNPNFSRLGREICARTRIWPAWQHIISNYLVDTGLNLAFGLR